VLEAFDYVGVLTIEFFVMLDGSPIANEMALRVSTGSLDDRRRSYLAVRATHPRRRGLAGPTTRIAAIEMLNLIGERKRLAQRRRSSAAPSLRQRDVRAGRNGSRDEACRAKRAGRPVAQ
jgi:5-(carboxyamino)imidazole ribonucleotide synthase